MRQIEHELYETETMAELCARQGRLHEAMAIYRRLVDTHPRSEPPIARWARGCRALEQAWGHAAGEEIEPEPIPLPRAPGVRVTANDDSVTVAWALPARQPEPTLELFLIQKTPSGVETSKRRCPWPPPAAAWPSPCPRCTSALAAVGPAQGDRFVPMARRRG